MRFALKMVCLSAALIGCGSLRDANAANAPPDAAVARQAQQLLADAVPADGPGAAVLVARGDEILFRGARGMAQMELGVPLRADHVFRIGSDTKQFVAATLLKLVEQGRLALADPLSKFIPDYPNGAHITIHELLNHTSGIKDYTEIDGYMRYAIREDVETAKLIAAFKDQPVDFAPGTDWKYSNSGYVLIGAIIEKVTGKRWHEAVRELVLAPLQLTHTGYGADEALIPGRVAGYSLDEHDHIDNAMFISMTQPGGSGGMVSNVDDLFHWLRALHNGKVLDVDSYRRLVTPAPTASGKPADYGYGVFTRRVRGEAALAHEGRIPGFSAAMAYVPAPGVSVVVLANTDSGQPNVQMLAAELAAVALGRPYPKRQPVMLNAAQMQDLAGVYTSDDGERRALRVRDGKLYTQHGDGPPHEMRVSSAGELYFDEVLDYFVVSRDAAGHVIALEKFADGEGPAQHWPKSNEALPADAARRE